MKVPAGMDTNCIAWPPLCWRFYNEFANRASPAISGSTPFTMQSRSGTTFSSGGGLTKNEYRGGRTEGVGPRLGSAQERPGSCKPPLELMMTVGSSEKLGLTTSLRAKLREPVGEVHIAFSNDP